MAKSAEEYLKDLSQEQEDLLKRFNVSGGGSKADGVTAAGGRLASKHPINASSDIEIGASGHYAKGKGFKDAGGNELKIRVEYGLAENINYGMGYLPKIEAGSIAEDFYPSYFYKDRDGNVKYNPFDDHLSYESHKLNYPEHLDLSHQPLFGIEDINNCNMKKEFQMQIQTAKRIIDAPESGIVVSHGWMQSFFPQYVLLNKNHISPVEVDALLQGSTELNFVVIYNQNQDGTWERSLKPQRII